MVSIPHWRYQQEDAQLNQNPSQKISILAPKKRFYLFQTFIRFGSHMHPSPKRLIKRFGVAQKL